jgi:uncharacterized protein YgiM (DUF1202 family)
MQIYQSPGGPVIGTLKPNQLITVLLEEKLYENLMWVKIIDEEGREGWIPKIYVFQLTATPTATGTDTPVVTESPTPSASSSPTP